MNKKNLDTFEIFQVKPDCDFKDYHFEDIEQLTLKGLKIEYNHYHSVYEDKLYDGLTLEDIFIQFNEKIPPNFKGRFLSVSDVIVLNQKGYRSAHFVDSFGFKNIPEFLLEMENIKNSKSDDERTDRRSNDKIT